jgi:hypothetical protein
MIDLILMLILVKREKVMMSAVVKLDEVMIVMVTMKVRSLHHQYVTCRSHRHKAHPHHLRLGGYGLIYPIITLPISTMKKSGNKHSHQLRHHDSEQLNQLRTKGKCGDNVGITMTLHHDGCLL